MSMSDTESSEGIQSEASTRPPNMSISNASTSSTGTSRSHLKVSPPGPLCVANNMAVNWRLWKQMWDNYAILTDLDMHPMQYQVVLFLHSIGPDTLKIYNGMVLCPQRLGT